MLLPAGTVSFSRATSLLTDIPVALPASNAHPLSTQPLPNAATQPSVVPSLSLPAPGAGPTPPSADPIREGGAQSVPTHTHVKAEAVHLPASPPEAAPSLISAVTQAAGGGVGTNPTPDMHTLLEDGYVRMPPMPADLQAELASSASSSFSGIASFGMMQQQLSSTFDSSQVLPAGDLAADLISSPHFAVTDHNRNGAAAGAATVPGEAAAAAAAAASVAAVNAAVSNQLTPVINTPHFNASAGPLTVFVSCTFFTLCCHMQTILLLCLHLRGRSFCHSELFFVHQGSLAMVSACCSCTLHAEQALTTPGTMQHS